VISGVYIRSQIAEPVNRVFEAQVLREDRIRTLATVDTALQVPRQPVQVGSGSANLSEDRQEELRQARQEFRQAFPHHSPVGPPQVRTGSNGLPVEVPVVRGRPLARGQPQVSLLREANLRESTTRKAVRRRLP
jgi:hypothetical protein